MNRASFAACLTIVLGLSAVATSGVTLAHPLENGEQVKIVGLHQLAEKFDGKDSDVTVVEVTIDPGKAGLPHRHPGPAIVYVIEGEYELGIDNKPTKIFKAGETFSEPSGCLHSVSRNPSKTTRTRLVAFVLHPRDAKEVAIPEPMDESHHAPGASH